VILQGHEENGKPRQSSDEDPQTGSFLTIGNFSDLGKNDAVTAPLILSFDLDDTLWPVSPVITAAESELFSWLRARYPRTVSGHDIESMRALRAGVTDRFPERGHDLTFLRHRALKDLFAAAGHAESLADEALEVFFSARNRVEFYDDVRPSLLRLRSRYRLFALSNGNADLGRCGIADLFAGHVTARSAGAAKPDARIYAALVELAGVEAHRVLHVGDDPLADVVGATRAGMQAVWINRDAREWPKEFAPPARTITTLAEII
jgi:putative hydrolase of the HAD superfamily